MVAQRRKELVQQIAVRGVDLEEFESRRQGAARGSLESRDDGIDADLIERDRRRFAFIERNGTVLQLPPGVDPSKIEATMSTAC
jgi:hypothetical protein